MSAQTPYRAVNTTATDDEPDSVILRRSSSIRRQHLYSKTPDGSVSTLPMASTTSCAATEDIPLAPLEHPSNTQPKSPTRPTSRMWVPKWPAWTRFWNDGWLWEIASVILSSACMIAVIVVLGCVQGMPLKHWNFMIQPNSLVSVFMTVAKSAILVPMSSCISQAMWVRFKQAPDSLIALEAYDEASRGPWGSMQLLFHSKLSDWVTSMGAVVTLLALAIEPFTQQIIAFPSRAVPSKSERASLHALRNLTMGHSEEERRTAAIESLFDLPAPGFTCTTSKCRWPAFTSLGICTACRNLTSETSPQCSTVNSNFEHDTSNGETILSPYNLTTCNFSLPDDLSFSTYSALAQKDYQGKTLWYDYRYSSAKSMTRYVSTSNLAGLTSSIAGNHAFRLILYSAFDVNFTSLASRSLPDVIPYELIECELYWCAQVYDSAVAVNGSLEFGITESYALTFSHKLNNMFGGDEYFLLNVTGSPRDESLDYSFQLNWYASQITSVLKPLFDYSVRTAGYYYDEALPEFPDGPSNGSSFLEILYRSGNVTETVQKIARGMTHFLRNENDSIIGEALISETYVAVRWGWIALPLSVLLLSVVHLVITMQRSRNHKSVLWKSSSLALLFHGLHGWEGEDLDVGDVTRMKRTAEEMRARLAKDEDEQLKFVRS